MVDVTSPAPNAQHPAPYFANGQTTLWHGDSLAVLRALSDASVDAIVTDPPYGLEFMGKEWDGADGFRRSLNPNDAGRDNAFGRTSRTSPEYNTGRGARVLTERSAELTERGKGHSTSSGPYLASGVDSVRVAGRPFQEWCEAWSRECLRVLKPGGHMLAFGGTRTFHRLACAVEDAGFEVRDSIAWLYGSGFPKSLNLVDSAGERTGWGTALKPAFEPIVVARKPLSGTVAANVLTHGVGALNIDATRITTTDDLNGGAYRKEAMSCTDGIASTATKNLKAPTTPGSASDTKTPSPDGPSSTPRSTGRHDGAESWRYVEGGAGEYVAPAGRWPANVILDESQAGELDAQSGELTSGAWSGKRNMPKFGDQYGDFEGREDAETPREADSGGASRFFYVAKADASERVRVNGIAHPTVKPLALMRWLVRLVTPPGGTVLEPFAGSGTTVEACILEGFRCVAIEREPDYLPLIVQRINRRRDPVAAVKASAEDGGLFDLLEGGVA